MARYKEYSYQQSELIPVYFEEQILPGTFEYGLNYVVDHELDLSIFEGRYRNDETGAPSFDQAILMRMEIADPVFGNLRWNLGLDRFTLRGKVKVDIQWKLFAMVHNIGKILRYGMAPA